jgi:tellurite methyltransferase
MTGDGPNASIRFFDAQFRRQVREREFVPNPFEQAALPHLRGRVLDLGCGVGNLSVEAARRGCSVVALDACAVAIDSLRERALAEHLDIDAREVDLRSFGIAGEFDAIACIGLLMFFDCPTAARILATLQGRVRSGGVAIVNVLVEGTTYLEMFEPTAHCLFARTGLEDRFAGWQIVDSRIDSFAAPGGREKVFSTVTARKPPAQGI